MNWLVTRKALAVVEMLSGVYGDGDARLLLSNAISKYKRVNKLFYSATEREPVRGAQNCVREMNETDAREEEREIDDSPGMIVSDWVSWC